MRSSSFTRRHSKLHRRPRHTRRGHLVGLAAGLAVIALGFVLAFLVGEQGQHEAPEMSQPAAVSQPAAPTADTGVRKVYPYSVIEGGAENVDELKRAIESDPVVAEHFKDFDLEKTRVERLSAPKIAHVSYRKGDDVFWTRKPTVIPAGETVLTDGTNIARTRCGNNLSEAAASPVSEAEPEPAVLDTPELVLRSVRLTNGAYPRIPDAGGPDGSIASGPPGGGSPRGTRSPGPAGPGGIGGPGPGGSTGSLTPPPGVEAPADETLGGGDDPLDPADSGEPGTTRGSGGNDGNPGNPGGPGQPGNPPGAPGNPPSTPDNPFVPPSGPPTGGNPDPPGGPFNPPGGPFNPPGGPFDPPGGPFDPPGGPFDPPGGPFDPPGGPFDPPGGPFDPPGGPFDPPGDGNPPGNPTDLPRDVPGDPGDPGDPAKPTETVPEPGTTVLLLVGGIWAARRLRRRYS